MQTQAWLWLQREGGAAEGSWVLSKQPQGRTVPRCVSSLHVLFCRMKLPRRAGAGCITEQHRVSTEPLHMGTAKPDQTLSHTAELLPAARGNPRLALGHKEGSPAPAPGLIHTHYICRFTPHPNPQPTLALGPAPGRSSGINSLCWRSSGP